MDGKVIESIYSTLYLLKLIYTHEQDNNQGRRKAKLAESPRCLNPTWIKKKTNKKTCS